MKPTILFRASLAEEDELASATKHMIVTEQRSRIPRNSLVIGRYSVLPYYRELEQDLKVYGSRLINSHSEYEFISNISNWYPVLKDVTPQTWFTLHEIPEDHPGSFVQKGDMNSRKQLWKTHMFAKTRSDIMTVYGRLLDDSLLQHQKIAIREFVDLQSDGVNIIGMPIAKEFRLFILDGKIMSSGYYWSVHEDEVNMNTDPAQIPSEFIDEIISRIGDQCRFWALDVGQKTNGEWIVIEMGDAQMNGLSANDPDVLYSNIAKHFERGDDNEDA